MKADGVAPFAAALASQEGVAMSPRPFVLYGIVEALEPGREMVLAVETRAGLYSVAAFRQRTTWNFRCGFA